MARYRTKDGDVLDAVCLAWYGRARGVVEAVLAANPGLAERGPVLPAGILIELPEFNRTPVNEATIRLWG
ncbi:phage tail protein [Marinobacter lutaoensis]|uniref:Phage tail protein n=1 Tax=Marinobacter lutaoensis TaxID=135739 RepID=A0A1V2DS87_9GAMM|nr:tail protein X [Marinobacter lutaoensis]ONF43266.1 phage tail protein [Marinobacter lutaoensis]